MAERPVVEGVAVGRDRHKEISMANDCNERDDDEERYGGGGWLQGYNYELPDGTKEFRLRRVGPEYHGRYE